LKLAVTGGADSRLFVEEARAVAWLLREHFIDAAARVVRDLELTHYQDPASVVSS